MSLAGGPAVIRGVVRDAAGVPVANVRVLFADGPAPVPDVAALTDAAGMFALSAPAAGTYVLECHAEGFAPARVSVAVPAPGGEELSVTLR
jgi:hypothetical protein